MNGVFHTHIGKKGIDFSSKEQINHYFFFISERRYVLVYSFLTIE